LFLLTLFDFIKIPDKRNLIICGVALGIAGLSNTQAFFDSMLVFGLAFLYFYVIPIFMASKKLEDFKESENFELLKKYLSVFLIGFAIALLFWFKPIFINYGETPNNVQDFTRPDIRDPTVLWKMILGQIEWILLPYLSSLTWIFTALSLYGLYHVFRTVHDVKVTPPNAAELGDPAPSVYAHQFTFIVLIAWFLAMIHPLITLPLMDKHFVMEMMAERLGVISVMLISIGASKAFDKVNNKNHAKIGMVVLILFATLLYADHMTAMKNDRWIQVGQTGLDPSFIELGNWIRANTNVNDVFITTNENGFMLNAISGRKIVSYRRAHASPYIDMNQRMIDQAIMTYGTNPQKTKELLKKYDVKYLLWSQDWLMTEYSFDQNGQLAGISDPLSVPDKQEYEERLAANGVRYLKLNTYLDPAPPTNAPKYDIIVAIPTGDTSIELPYTQQFLDNFELVKEMGNVNGMPKFRIYKIKE
ncbi:MAG: hypothetical protein ABII22_01640, partial [Candidatus Micrarchaeota archaeon]